MLIAGRLGSITPTIGVRFELDVLTAAILGGVAFSGGAGRPLGIAIGVATIGILNAGLIFVGLQSWWQSIAVGGMLLLALVADQVAIGFRAPARHALRSRPSQWPKIGLAASTVPVGSTAGGQRRRGIDAGPAFSIAGARKSYGALTALEEADFTVGRGEIVCLLGDNGAGKSTLGEDHLRRYPPDAGAMTLEGRPFSLQEPAGRTRRRSRDGLSGPRALPEPQRHPQHDARPRGNPPLARHHSRSETIERPPEQCRARLAALGVTLRDENVLVRSLSGGQRQSIAIARSLARTCQTDMSRRADRCTRRQADGAGHQV